MVNGKRILAFVFGVVFAVAGGGFGLLALWRMSRGGQIVLVFLAGFGLLFAVLGAGLVYVAVVGTDNWADGSTDIETAHTDIAPGSGGGDE
ncbi:MAG: hypothetical protein ABEI98_07245 [Halorhabdus sp.]